MELIWFIMEGGTMKVYWFMCLSGKRKGDTMNGSQSNAFDDKQGSFRERFDYSRRERTDG